MTRVYASPLLDAILEALRIDGPQSTAELADRLDKRRTSVRAMAQALTKMTDTLHVLDHIVPINGPWVCGLTVPWNPDQLELSP